MNDDDELRMALMSAQIETLQAEREKLRAETERFRQELQWEPWKALAAILAGVAAMAGVILAVAHFLPPPAPQPIVIQVPAPK